MKVTQNVQKCTTSWRMKLIFNHEHSVFDGSKPLIHLEAEKEEESAKYMFEYGWVPHGNLWYQTKSSRLKLGSISKRRKYELKRLNISEKTSNQDIIKPPKIEYYAENFYDFFFDDIFWGRVNFYEDQILYSVMNGQFVHHKKSYGTLSFYYLIDKFKSNFEYLYITDFFDNFGYKKNLPGFQCWNGKEWIN